MTHAVCVLFIALVSFGISALLGKSEVAGLFGAIVAVGWYAANAKGIES